MKRYEFLEKAPPFTVSWSGASVRYLGKAGGAVFHVCYRGEARKHDVSGHRVWGCESADDARVNLSANSLEQVNEKLKKFHNKYCNGLKNLL